MNYIQVQYIQVTKLFLHLEAKFKERVKSAYEMWDSVLEAQLITVHVHCTVHEFVQYMCTIVLQCC